MTPAATESFDGIWPGNRSQMIRVLFNGKTTESLSGPWAWLKFIDKHPLNPLKNKREYAVSIQHNSMKSTFKLTANADINPYIPGFFTQFRLPMSIYSKEQKDT